MQIPGLRITYAMPGCFASVCCIILAARLCKFYTRVQHLTLVYMQVRFPRVFLCLLCATCMSHVCGLRVYTHATCVGHACHTRGLFQ